VPTGSGAICKEKIALGERLLKKIHKIQKLEKIMSTSLTSEFGACGLIRIVEGAGTCE
jgi:hypothetical protein